MTSLGSEQFARARGRIQVEPTLDGGSTERAWEALRRTRTVARKNRGEDAAVALAMSLGATLLCEDASGRRRARAAGKALKVACFRTLLLWLSGRLQGDAIELATRAAEELDGFRPDSQADCDDL